MMTRMAMICCILAAVSLTSAAALGGITYSGILSTDQNGLEGTGFWVDSGVSTIQWWVTDNGDHWHYKYTISVPRTEISHFIIGVSPEFGQHVDDYYNVTGPFGVIEIQTFTQANGNPDIPAPLWGMKFDETEGLTVTLEFDSVRHPVWGDFYAKAGGAVPHQIWNSGFLAENPTAAIGSGSLGNHLLVPDTVIPEPATMALLGLGLVALVARRKSLRAA